MSVTIQVFDPAMCCSTGICGPGVEPHLIQFAADLEWLRSNGVIVERYNLAQQPQAFVENVVAKQALETGGESALPLVVVNGAIQSSGGYPLRTQLADWANLPNGEQGKRAPTSSSSCCGPKAHGSEQKPSRCC